MLAATAINGWRWLPTGASEVATIFSALFALAGVIALYYARAQLKLAREQSAQQFRDNTEIADRTHAREVWRDYIRLSVEYPALSIGDGLAGRDNDPIEFERYEWYMAAMLWACEEVLRVFSRDSVWRDTVKLQLSWHSNYLKAQFRQGRRDAFYSAELRDMIAEVVK